MDNCLKLPDLQIKVQSLKRMENRITLKVVEAYNFDSKQ